MPVRSLLKTFRIALGTKIVRRLGLVVARREGPDAAHRQKARAQRIKRQKWKLERQNRHIEAKDRQIEHLQKKLAEANSREALWEKPVPDFDIGAIVDIGPNLVNSSFGRFVVAYRSGTTDEDVLDHSFDRDIFFRGYQSTHRLKTM